MENLISTVRYIQCTCVSPEHIIIVENEVIANNSDAIFARAKELQRQGWEGVVLRHPTISYEEGGSHKLLKVVVYPTFRTSFCSTERYINYHYYFESTN